MVVYKKEPPKDEQEEDIRQGLELFSLKWGRIVMYILLLCVVMILLWNPEWLQ